jgi:low affinity Fe/Cu permease
MKDAFRKFAHKTSEIVGSPIVFLSAVATIVIWAVLGPQFHYSDTWQLVINTGTTIITFLMVFLIQNTQNRDAKAIHLKLDELLKGVKGARTNLVNLENFSEQDLEQLQKEFEQLNKDYSVKKDKIAAEFERREKMKQKQNT